MNLHWLPAAQDWRDRIHRLSSAADASFDDLVAAANQRLDFLQTIQLDRCARRTLAAQAAPMGTLRLAVLSSSTTEHLLPALRIAALRRRVQLAVYCCAYGQYRQELENPASGLHEFAPHCMLFTLHAEALLGEASRVSADETAVQDLIERAVRDLQACWSRARALCGGQIIQQTFLPTAHALMGNNEHRLPGSLLRMTERLNVRLRETAPAHGVDLLALDSRAAVDGLSSWHDPALWRRAKQLISPAAAPLFGDLAARLIAASAGRSYKCAVLDLDNTLWGGVVGDDGVHGITLGQGSAAGEAFVAFQRYLKELSQRGVILAVCSKNDEANALAPFESHPDMVLRRADIACFVANWTDKAANVRAIARTLNVGIDSLVFIDDNPFERGIVRRELPQVATPELPEDPTLYPRCLADAGYFESLTVTTDDLARGRQYQSNLERESLRANATDLDGYLRSLSMELRWGPFDAVSLPRVTQLINKTNQFNLTTRRYTEAEVARLMHEAHTVTLQLRLTDTLGDNGIIGVVIAKQRPEEPGAYLIDTWLMSCRVLGRQVELATLNLLVEQVLAKGGSVLYGRYIPTEKNGMVRGHYETLRFTRQSEAAEDALWQLHLSEYVPAKTAITAVGCTS